MKSAMMLAKHSQNGHNIHDLFLFSNDLESIGKWYRQLMGESIGKEYDAQGKQVFNGMTPTVSIGSTDLHSMAQLYLGGPYDKYTTFVRLQKNNHTVRVPRIAAYSKLVDTIQGRPMDEIMNAIVDGVQTAFKKGKRPFSELLLPDKSAFTIGQLLQFFMMQMMYLGVLMHVNPFDQPNVESYKVETKRLLQKS
jgi:glucose-6-phosphate isomerase